MDQPYMTMQVLLFVQAQYKKMLSEKVEKMKAKTTRGRRSR